MYYLDVNQQGERAVLMLHGLGADGTAWAFQTPALAQAGLRVIVPDLPGFGQSPCPAGRWTLKQVASDCAGLLLDLGLQKVHVVGHSMGSAVAQVLTLQFPSIVDRLVLASAFTHLRPEGLAQTRYLLKRMMRMYLKGMHAQADVVARHLFPEPDQELYRRMLRERILATDPAVYRKAARALIGFDVRRRLSEIRIPVLFIIPENDTTVPAAHQLALAGRIPRAKVVVIPGARHAVTVDSPQQVNDALLEFLAI